AKMQNKGQRANNRRARNERKEATRKWEVKEDYKSGEKEKVPGIAPKFEVQSRKADKYRRSYEISQRETATKKQIPQNHNEQYPQRTLKQQTSVEVISDVEWNKKIVKGTPSPNDVLTHD